jgi:ABC-type branched-subunit amino acid transport system ATPase component
VTVLRLEGVRGGYPSHPVLFGVDLSLDDGQRLALLGRNGAGKTTLLRTIVGQLPTTGGRLTLDGQDLGGLRAFRRARIGIGYVAQGQATFAGLSVTDNLRVAAMAADSRPWRQRVEALLEEFPLLGEKRSAPGERLSGGQQRLLALARSLLTEPRILLLDEPTEGIQPSILDELSATILRVSAQRGMSVLIAEQNLDFAARLADRALVLEKGRISAELPTAELQDSRDLQRQHLAV